MTKVAFMLVLPTIEFRSHRHDGILEAAAKFINQTSGLQRKFIMLSSAKA